MKKCKMTMSGKHIWTKELGSFTPDGAFGFYEYITMCKACKMIDDRKKKNAKSK